MLKSHGEQVWVPEGRVNEVSAHKAEPAVPLRDHMDVNRLDKGCKLHGSAAVAFHPHLFGILNTPLARLRPCVFTGSFKICRPILAVICAERCSIIHAVAPAIFSDSVSIYCPPCRRFCVCRLLDMRIPQPVTLATTLLVGLPLRPGASPTVGVAAVSALCLLVELRERLGVPALGACLGWGRIVHVIEPQSRLPRPRIVSAIAGVY